MINRDYLRLEKAIIHRLDNTNHPKGKVLSDIELPLNEELKSVIQEHAVNAINEKRKRYAQFIDPQNNLVHGSSMNVQKNCTDFVSESKKIANHLFLNMSNRNISPADLVICYLHDDINSFVCLLKLDYKEQYISQVEDTPTGEKMITIRKEDKGWPEIGSRIQKAAFIKVTNVVYDGEDKELSPQLIVLDRQQSSGDEGEVSQFFKDAFLSVNLISDERSNTRAFVKGLHKFLGEDNPNITYEKRRSIYDQGLSLISNNDQVDIESFLDTQFDREDSIVDIQISKEFKAHLEEAGVSRDHFSVDQGIASLYQTKRTVKLEGIKLEIETDLYNGYDERVSVKFEEDNGQTLAYVKIDGYPVE